MNAIDVSYYHDPPSYETFLNSHLLPNIPALLGPSLTASWKARLEWVVPIDHSSKPGSIQPSTQPNYSLLRDRFGAAEVQVADCSTQDFTDQKRSTMSFHEFVDLWQNSPDTATHYLKDWHFAQAFPDHVDYTVPDVFADDWLNEYWLQGTEDDYRFCYMGGDGTFTPFHADVYRSYSWSSNICGVKKWTLFPPGQESLYKDNLGNYVYDIRNVDPSTFPQFENARRIVIYQRDGETLFVPSGWFHQVENIGATISINHNWSNACNLRATQASLSNDLMDVRRSIEDVQNMMEPLEFTETCQHLLLVHSGWNWSVFIQLLECIVQRLTTQVHHVFQPDPAWQVKQMQDALEELQKEDHLVDYLTSHNLGSCYAKLVDHIHELAKSS